MALIGQSHNQVSKDRSLRVSGMVICNFPTGSLTKDKQYSIRGHFCYLNRINLGERDFCWQWDQFITIKNDEGWTVKVRLSRFSLKSEVDKKAKDKLEYETNPLNILQEAHQLIPQRYV